MMGNKTYDVAKYLVQVVLPAIGTLYFTLAQIWGLPYGEQIVGTLAAVALFVGVLVGISKKQYDAKLEATFALDDTVQDLSNED